MESDLASAGELHRVRISRSGRQLFDERAYVVHPDLGVGAAGFFAGLDADADPELELVHCNEGVVLSFFEPDAERMHVVTRQGRHASEYAREVCAAIGRAGRPPRIDCATCCGLPFVIAFLASVAVGILHAREARRRRALTEF